METKPVYRPDIDGLRAIAVLAVIFFHAQIPGFTGGFVGVDIFFVISGFLITRIIVAELSAGTFSYTRFIAQRVRRIFPALFFVLGCTTILAFFLLTYPPDIATFARALYAQSLFFSNVYFMSQDTYFSDTLETNPLLHTWSLSLEEQFYILFPLVVAALFALHKRLVPLGLFGLAVASFIFSIYLAHSMPTDLVRYSRDIQGTGASIAFFFLLPRAWELLMGALIALWQPTIANAHIRNGMSILGIALLGGAIFFFSPHTPFPGLYALVPILGTALVIAAGMAARFNAHALSWQPVASVGILSYALYLWHWPILTIAHTYAPTTNMVFMAVLFVLIFAAAFFTHRYIERPFREKRVLTHSRDVLVAGIGVVVVFASMGAFLRTYAQTLTIPPSVSALGITVDTFSYLKLPLAEPVEGTPYQGRLLGDLTQPTSDIFLYGDSHADMLAPSIDTLAKAHKKRVTFVYSNRCKPLFDAVAPRALVGEMRPDCKDIAAYVHAYLASRPPRSVIFAVNWQSYRDSTGFADTEVRWNLFLNALEAFTQSTTAQGIAVYAFEQFPQHHAFTNRSLFYGVLLHGTDSLPPPLPYAAYQEQRAYVSEAFKRIHDIPGAHTIDPSAALCTKAGCPVVKDSQVLYRDWSHVNAAGAQALDPLLVEIFAQ